MKRNIPLVCRMKRQLPQKMSPTCKVKSDWLVLLCFCFVIGQLFAPNPHAATPFPDLRTS